MFTPHSSAMNPLMAAIEEPLRGFSLNLLMAVTIISPTGGCLGAFLTGAFLAGAFLPLAPFFPRTGATSSYSDSYSDSDCSSSS